MVTFIFRAFALPQFDIFLLLLLLLAPPPAAARRTVKFTSRKKSAERRRRQAQKVDDFMTIGGFAPKAEKKLQIPI